MTYNMAENSWHRYDMKKLRHCHPMYTERKIVARFTYWSAAQ